MKRNTEEELIQIRDLWKMSVSKWHWFLLSLAVSLLVAFAYLSITPPIYTRTASVLIKDNSKGGLSLDDVSSFSEMGLFRASTNINNEIFTLKSPLLMREVVQRLKLNESYSIKGFFRDEVLYKNAPVVVSFDAGEPDAPFSCFVDLLPQNKVKVSGLVVNGSDSNDSGMLEGYLNEPVDTQYGKITVSPTAFYSAEYHGRQISFSRASVASVVNYYTKALNASLGDEKSTIVSISLNDASIGRAEDVLSMLIDVYNEYWVEDRNQIAVSTSVFIDERLNVIENELGHVDDNISIFKSQNLMPDIEAASRLYMTQSTEYSTSLLALNTQHTLANYVLAYLKDAKTKDQLLPANLGIEKSGVEGQINEYNATLLRYKTLLASSSEKNPQVSDMNESLATMRNAIIGSIQNLLVTLDTQIKDIQRSERRTTERIASSPKQAMHLLSIERQQKVKEALYLFLLQKREENQLSQAFIAYNTKTITPPSGGMSPSAPRKIPVLAIAFAIGVLLPVAAIFLIENLDTTVRRRKDLSALSLPFIGEIPLIVAGRKKKILKSGSLPDKNKIVVEEGKRDYMNEAFRVARTNLDFMISASEENSRKAIMLTSFNVCSGKTFAAINLAISMAAKGKRVVAIDLDMRKATLSTFVDSPPKGVSSYLGKLIDDANQIIQKGVIHPNLDIIPVGIIPPNPAELLLDDRLQELMDILKKQYDYLFIDCTPVDIVTDALIVGKITGLTIFVIRAGLMDRRMLPDLEELYKKKQLNNMGLLLNGTNHIRNKNGYKKDNLAYGK